MKHITQTIEEYTKALDQQETLWDNWQLDISENDKPLWDFNLDFDDNTFNIDLNNW